MLNILIAKLSNTYHNIQDDAVKGLLVYRAKIIARSEKNEWKLPPFTVKQLFNNHVSVYYIFVAYYSSLYIWRLLNYCLQLCIFNMPYSKYNYYVLNQSFNTNRSVNEFVPLYCSRCLNNLFFSFQLKASTLESKNKTTACNHQCRYL